MLFISKKKYMNLDLKNNNYLLSLVSGIVGTVICFIIDKVSSKEENVEIDYMKYIKTCVVISACVLCALLYIRSDSNVKGVSENSVNKIGETISNSSIESSGLQEVNMNQNIHTGNPQF